MVRRRSTPAASPASMLVKGQSWLNEMPVFDVGGDQAMIDVLSELHRTCRLLAKRRRELRLSQTQVAQWAGVTAQTVAAIEDGATWPDHLTLLRIASALGATVETRVVAGKSIGPSRISGLLTPR